MTVRWRSGTFTTDLTVNCCETVTVCFGSSTRTARLGSGTDPGLGRRPVFDPLDHLTLPPLLTTLEGYRRLLLWAADRARVKTQKRKSIQEILPLRQPNQQIPGTFTRSYDSEALSVNRGAPCRQKMATAPSDCWTASFSSSSWDGISKLSLTSLWTNQ